MKILFLGIVLALSCFSFIFINSYETDIIIDEKLNGIEIIRYQDYLVYYYYNAEREGKTGTNQWGYEIAVSKDNVVVMTATNVIIPEGGYAISGVGKMKTILQNVKVGDNVIVDLDNLNVKVQRNTISSSLNQAKINLEKARLYIDEANSVFYDYDINLVDNKYDEMLDYYQKMKKLGEDKSINESDEDKIVEYASIINKNLNDIIFITSPSKKVEVRAIWHRPRSTTFDERFLSGIVSFLQSVKNLGINTIYLETFWNGYVSYRSEILQTHPTVAASYYGEEYGYDYVKAFVTEAEKLNIDVYAWFHTFNAGSSSYKADCIKEEWLLETYEGTVLHPNIYGGAYYMDPSNEEVLEFLENVFVETITNYNFKGVQYDYIRYYDNNYNITPYRDSGYGKLSENKFKDEYNITEDVREIVKTTEGREKWNEWRQANINNAVHRFSQKLRSINPNIIISAAVVSEIAQAKKTYMQDWLSWVNNGDIDLLCPMIYMGSYEAVGKQTSQIVKQMQNMSFLAGGIAPIYYGYSLVENNNQIIISNEIGDGCSYFASHNIFSSYIGLSEVEQSLLIGAYRKDSLNPLTSSVDQVLNKYNQQLLYKLKLYLERKLISDDTHNLLKNIIQGTLKNELRNPKELEEVKDEYIKLRLFLYNINDDSANTDFTKLVDEIINYLEKKINRYLINYGYWDPSKDNKPKIEDLDFNIEDDSDSVSDDIDDDIKDNLQNSSGCRSINELLKMPIYFIPMILLIFVKRKLRGI